LNIVLDTNVLVSGLLSPHGAPAAIVRMVASGTVTLCADARVLGEYALVLARPKFGFAPGRVSALLDLITADAIHVAPDPLRVRLPDPDDEPFLEAALSEEAVCLVTGNLAHFPPAARAGATVMSPTEFVQLMRDR